MTVREGQTFGGASRVARYASFVKLPHTVFALPFALVGVVLATDHAPLTMAMLMWIVIAFTSARFAAMGFNRIVDRHIDARNPRTAARELPAGTMTLSEAVASVVCASLVFVLASWRLNTLCALLSPVALALVFAYSYTKRFTRWSHLVLGLGLAIAPVGGYLAVTGRWSDPWWMLCALALAVVTWSAGFDILYALQDVDFDRENALHSVPAAFGQERALVIARALHVGTVAFLAAAGIGSHAGRWYVAGVAAAASLLVYEHRLVSPNDLSKLDAAFFRMNGVISIVFLVFVIADHFAR